MAEILVRDETGALPPATLAALARGVAVTLRGELGDAERACEVGVTVVGPERIRELNRQWRGVDEVTDVLSFPLQEGRPEVEPDDELALGDIVVCPEGLHGPRDGETDGELVLLTAHGTLHLLGYDHAAPDEERAMFALQDRYAREAMSP